MNQLLKKKLNKKGFTLAELLIVVAIIAVLVAIAIPVFTKRLEHAKETTDMANLRSAYAAAQVAALTDKVDDTKTYYFDAKGTTGSALAALEGLTETKTAGTAIGQGTATNGNAKSGALPGVCKYDNSTDVREKYIQIEFENGQVSEIKFAS